MSDLKIQRVSVLVHAVLGVIAGYISIYFSRFWYSLGFSIAVLIIIGFVGQKTYAKGKDRKWWAGNGIAIYILVWLVSWILFFNLMPIPQKIF